MTILDERGVFWWNEEDAPDELLAPDLHVAGRCKIEDDGRTFLDLDGYLPGRDGAMAAMVGGPVTTCIQGLLKESGDRILLSDLVRTGGRFSTNGISFERYVATNSLVGREPFAFGRPAPDFDKLDIPLRGFEAWMRLGAIKLLREDGNIIARYVPPSDLTYYCDDASLLVIFDATTDSAGVLGTHSFSLKETALLRLNLKDECPLSELRTKYGMFEDLLKLLTGSDHDLDWPRLSQSGGSTYRWYFPRYINGSIAPPEYHDTITNFPELRDQFGSIWTRWNAGRDKFGPGFYLYLGTRRGLVLFRGASLRKFSLGS